jgi:hypothetical protein
VLGKQTWRFGRLVCDGLVHVRPHFAAARRVNVIFFSPRAR